MKVVDRYKPWEVQGLTMQEYYNRVRDRQSRSKGVK